MAYRILVTESMAEDGPIWLREQGYEVKYGRGVDPRTLIEDLQNCDGVIPRLAVMSDEVISACPRLKVIARHGAGVDTVDLESCKRHGVRVLNTPGSNSIAVAEHAMALMMACAKTLGPLQSLYREGRFKEARKNAGGVELSKKTLGLLGFGHIGEKIARIAHDGFGMAVVAYDPYLCGEHAPGWLTLASNRDEVFGSADFISVHMAATPETKKSIGTREFELMKPTAYFINTARGALVDESALIEALQTHRIAGAGLDATDPEPALPDSPLFALPNVYLTPHCAGSTLESKKRSSLWAAQGCDEILTGKQPTSPVV